jgi:hypothetical protein
LIYFISLQINTNLSSSRYAQENPCLFVGAIRLAGEKIRAKTVLCRKTPFPVKGDTDITQIYQLRVKISENIVKEGGFSDSLQNLL